MANLAQILTELAKSPQPTGNRYAAVIVPDVFIGVLDTITGDLSKLERDREKAGKPFVLVPVHRVSSTAHGVAEGYAGVAGGFSVPMPHRDYGP